MKRTIQQLKPSLYEIFEHLHANPEPSWQEYETTTFLKQLFEKHHFSVQTFDDCPGLIVEVGHANGLTVGVRADIDALWQNVDGILRANHSCGHDAHMTIVVGVMLLFKEMNTWPNGKLKFIFQPAEEKGLGALKLIEKGVIDDLSYLYGVHLRPMDELKDGEAVPALLHGSAKFMKGMIHGESAHAARPHLGQNAIEIGATLVNELNRIHMNPIIPHSIKMTSFHAGTETANIIPGDATFTLDLRAQTNEGMDDLSKKVEKIVETVATLYNVEINLSTTAYVAAAAVHEEAKSFMEQAIIDTLGESNLHEPVVTPGGEDFHFYTLKRPDLKATMLGLGCDLKPGLHHPKMNFNHEAMFNGIEIVARTIIHTFK